eukprot:8095589-Pyramimonas_sp.AAC.1
MMNQEGAALGAPHEEQEEDGLYEVRLELAELHFHFSHRLERSSHYFRFFTVRFGAKAPLQDLVQDEHVHHGANWYDEVHGHLGAEADKATAILIIKGRAMTQQTISVAAYSITGYRRMRVRFGRDCVRNALCHGQVSSCRRSLSIAVLSALSLCRLRSVWGISRAPGLFSRDAHGWIAPR